MTTNDTNRDLQARLRELLAIPERDRTEEEWDEIVELEIQLSPGNRAGAPQPGGAPRQNGAPKKMQPKNPGPRQNQPNQLRKPPRAAGQQGKRGKEAAKNKPEPR